MSSIPTKEAVLAAERVLGFLFANPHMWNQHMWVVTPGAAQSYLEGEDEPHFTDHSVASPSTAFVLDESCGSTGCFCGWLTGDQGKAVFFPYGDAARASTITDHGEERIDTWAAEFLGLESGWGAGPAMFSEENNIHMLARWVRAIRHGYERKMTPEDAFIDLFGEEAQQEGHAEPSSLFSDGVTIDNRIKLQVGTITEDDLS